MALYTLLCALTLAIGIVRGNPQGPPAAVCPGLVPVSPAPHQKQDGDGGYFISTDLLPDSEKTMYPYTDGQTYIVTLRGETTFRGFIVQAQDQTGVQIGTFDITDPGQQQFLECAGIPPMTTVAHINIARDDFTSQVFNWTAPTGSNGYVNFMFTIVQDQPRYYGLLNAAAVILNRSSAVTNPTRSLDAYRTILRSPEGCARASCAIYVGIDINAGDSAYIDVYMEATAKAWVGVGFSATRSMFDADVLACNIVNGTEAVVAADTWNGPSPNRTNTLDTFQDVTLFSGSIVDGRLSCTIARRSAGSGSIESNSDVDLDGNYYVMYGWADNKRNNGALAGHVGIPTLTNNTMNVVQDDISITSGGSAAIATTPLVLALLAAIALFVNKGYSC